MLWFFKTNVLVLEHSTVQSIYKCEFCIKLYSQISWILFSFCQTLYKNMDNHGVLTHYMSNLSLLWLGNLSQTTFALWNSTWATILRSENASYPIASTHVVQFNSFHGALEPNRAFGSEVKPQLKYTILIFINYYY